MSTRQLPTASLSLHPEAALVPEMPADQYALFAADVKARGVLEPLRLIPGTRTVIDGRTRLRAATDARLPSVPVADADLGDESVQVYMIRLALMRRQLTSGQRAALAVEYEAQLAKAAKERQREGGKRGAAVAATKGVEILPQPAPMPAEPPRPSKPQRSRDQAAAIAGTNPRYVSDAKKLKDAAPAVYDQVKAGKLSLPEGKRQAKLTADPSPEPPVPVAGPLLPTEKASIGSHSLYPLLPCPFCGSADVMMIFGFAPKAGARTPIEYVRCKACGCTGPKPTDKATQEQVRAAWNERPVVAPAPAAGTLPGATASGSTHTGLCLVAGFPPAVLKACVKASLHTLSDVVRAAEALDPTAREDVRIYTVLRRLPGVSQSLAAQALDAVLGASLRLHTKLTAAELERLAFPAAVYGWCVTYSTNKGDQRECHFVGTEAVARRKALLKTGAKEVLKAQPLTEKQYVNAYGRGRS